MSIWRYDDDDAALLRPPLQENADKATDNCKNEQFKDEAAKADISHVDRQEGTMNNGTLGGNFDKEQQ